jgi:hypothetical protein
VIGLFISIGILVALLVALARMPNSSELKKQQEKQKKRKQQRALEFAQNNLGCELAS